jgi:hypothetical protein
MMDVWTDGDRVPTTFADIEGRLDALGPGSSTIVGVLWNDGGGHWFNAFNDKGVVRASDGRSGRSEPWPRTEAHLGFDETECATAFAVFVDSDGRHLDSDPPEEDGND